VSFRPRVAVAVNAMESTVAGGIEGGSVALVRSSELAIPLTAEIYVHGSGMSCSNSGNLGP
jgi:3-polyprenyl-4-hydroxybenzoate decarboxylase